MNIPPNLVSLWIHQTIVREDVLLAKMKRQGKSWMKHDDWKDGRDVGGNWKLAWKPVASILVVVYRAKLERSSRKKNSLVMITGYRWRGLFLTTTLFYRYCGVAGVLMRYTIACWLLNKKYESKMAAFAAIRHREAWFVPKPWLKIAFPRFRRATKPLPDLREFRSAFHRLMHRFADSPRWILNERAPCERSTIVPKRSIAFGKSSMEEDSGERRGWWW